MSDDNFAHVYISRDPIGILAFIVDGLSDRPRESFLSVTVNSHTAVCAPYRHGSLPHRVCSENIRDACISANSDDDYRITSTRCLFSDLFYIGMSNSSATTYYILKKIALLETFA